MDQEVDTYEQTLNNMHASEIKVWANEVIEKIGKVASLDDDEFIFLAGEKYRKYLIPHIRNSSFPLEGLPIGKQLRYLKELTI